MRMVTRQETLVTTNAITTSNTSAISVQRAKLFSIQSINDVNTPAVKTFVDGDVTVLTDVIAITAHGFTTGLKVRGTSTGTLPAGLALSTDYFVIVVTSGTIMLASSLALALAGTPVDITAAAGTGTHTLTPTAIAGATVTLQKSNDYSPITNTGTWDAVAAGTSIAADGIVWFEVVDPCYSYARLSYTLTAGQLSAAAYLIVKGDL